MTQTFGPVTGHDAAQTYAVALAYRRMLVWFGLSMLAAITMAILTGPSASQDPSAGMNPLVYVVAFPFQVVMLINVYRLAHAMEMTAWLWVFLLFMPCVALICLLLLGQKANTWLARRGIGVGLLGPSRGTLEALEQQVRASGAL